MASCDVGSRATQPPGIIRTTATNFRSSPPCRGGRVCSEVPLIELGSSAARQAAPTKRTHMPLRNLAWLLIVPAMVALALTVSYSAPAPDKDYQRVRQLVDVMAEVDTHFYRKLSDEE